MLLCSDSAALCHSQSVFSRRSRLPNGSGLRSIQSARIAVKCSLAAVMKAMSEIDVLHLLEPSASARLPCIDQTPFLKVGVVKGVQPAMRRLLAHESLGGDCGAVLPVGPRLSSYRIPAASPARGSQGPVLPRHR